MTGQAVELLAKKRDFLIPCSYHFYADPPVFERGSMQYLYDIEGRRYLDLFSGVSVAGAGHCNPAIVAASTEQLGKLQHLSSIYLTRPALDLAERLAGILPGGIRKSFFCCSGTEANEGAFLLARLHTGRQRILALSRGLHGRTYLGMSATGLPMWRTDPDLAPFVGILPGPYDEGAGRVTDMAMEASLDAIGRELGRDDVACLILEPVQGNGGIIPLPAEYLRRIRALTAGHGTLLVADEVQTALGRTGALFAIDRSGVEPDVVTMAKALGNGLPIAAFSTTDAIAASFTRPSASTLGGNPLSCATALAVIDYVENNGLCARSERLGARLMAGLRSLAARHTCVSDLRGAGLMIGAEIRDRSGQPDPARVDRILERAKDRGLLVGKNGLHRNVLAFQPPLVLGESDIDFALEVLDDVLGAENGTEVT